ncbi:maleylpyruvate isomerase family mycothiol-dependent enzyme [Nocardia sp. NPDC050710]|uniref:maleylpyruvate isomerase family mycothiol-dependent enzyme n=1 Tax=Nocardia sp. NPDC050710 TaxID=3157220 RepID=UPI003403495D
MADGAILTTEQIWRAVAAERSDLIDLLERLPESDWDHESLCEGWRVRDVVAHIVLSTHTSVGSILVNLVRARGDLHRMIRDTAIRRAERDTSGELLAQLRATIELRRTAIGTTPADRLMDLLVHGQDIAVPLGIVREMPLAAAESALDRVWTMGAPFHARRQWAGYRLVATDAAWSAGAGRVIEGPAAGLLLLVTGRHIGHTHRNTDHLRVVERSG